MKKEVRKNIFYILIIGIEGIAFGMLDWDSTISDLVYLNHNNKAIIAFLASSVSFAKFVATLICVKLSDSNKSNKIFSLCVIFIAICSLFAGMLYQLNNLILFSVTYIIAVLVLEIFSGYHYAYVYNSVPESQANSVHSKRIAIFKITFMIGIGFASILTTKFLNPMLTIAIFSACIFLLLLYPINKVRPIPKEKTQNKIPLLQKLNFKNYTSYFKNWIITRFLGKFALNSLVVILSMQILDKNMSFSFLKGCKTASWFISSIGFWLASYFVKKQKVIKGDITCKFLIAISIPITLFIPHTIYFILLLNGLLNPFNTMSNFTMIEKDEERKNIAQKEMIVNLFGYFASVLSSFILLSISRNIALTLIVITLSLSTWNELRLAKTKENLK